MDQITTKPNTLKSISYLGWDINLIPGDPIWKTEGALKTLVGSTTKFIVVGGCSHSHNTIEEAKAEIDCYPNF